MALQCVLYRMLTIILSQTHFLKQYLFFVCRHKKGYLKNHFETASDFILFTEYPYLIEFLS